MWRRQKPKPEHEYGRQQRVHTTRRSPHVRRGEKPLLTLSAAQRLRFHAVEITQALAPAAARQK